MRGFQTFNPLSNSFNPTQFLVSSPDEVEHALLLAEDAFDFWNASPSSSRANLLLAIKEELVEAKLEIGALYCSESGLSEPRFETEFQRTIFQLELFSDFLQNQFNTSLHIAKADSSNNLPLLQKTTQAIGTVLVIGSSNFPLAYSTIGGDSVAALSAGCPVIVKAHPMHAGTSTAVSNCVQRAIQKLHLPNGIFGHLVDDTHEIATHLLKHPTIKAVGFTGSINGGRALMDLAAKRPDPIPVFAEMGSCNPVVITESALKNTETWVPLFAQSVSTDAGQFCTKPGLFFIPDTLEGKNFAKQLEEKIIAFTPYYMLHPIIEQEFEFRKQMIRSIEGVSFTETNLILLPNQGKAGFATCEAKTFMNNPTLQEEVFGPFALAIFYKNQEALKNSLHALHGQLTFSIISEENKSNEFTQLLTIARKKAGRIILNGVPTGVRVDAAQHHGGPYPASSDARFTAVGTDSIYRFLRNITLQNFDF